MTTKILSSVLIPKSKINSNRVTLTAMIGNTGRNRRITSMVRIIKIIEVIIKKTKKHKDGRHKRFSHKHGNSVMDDKSIGLGS